LPIPGADLPHVHYLRTLDDSNAIIAAAARAQRVVVIGASFIGLEVAASLVARTLDVDVVAPESLPLERVLGPELGRMIHKLHLDHGVRFHLGAQAASISPEAVQLADGTTLAADLVVVGVGVRPDVSLAREAGLTVDDGVVVNEQLETSVRGIFAAGDIASWPDPRAGRIRVEHWVHAERQGQVAARNMLGANEAFTLPPFFWSQHYDVRIDYVGRAPRDAQRSVSGDPMTHDCGVRYTDANGALAACAEVGRDRAALEADLELERMR
ncbi:MAG TPA: FAD-dependent oxidoreductase, partial [Candidatus Elarobacter sp.]|nr:FAD-dependent oxidoreductase [Candidatus Elarobacter sp.]